jgi:hypothetical protein
MARKIHSLDDIRLDVFEALKRAYIKRGFVPRLSQKSEKTAEESDSDAKRTELIADLRAKSHDILFEARTFSPFPDSVRLDREKLTIVNRSYFKTAKIISVPVGAMLSAEADVGPIFGSIHMSSKYFVQNPYSVNLLWRKDAITLQRLLQGYIIAHEHKVDCSKLGKIELIKTLSELGQGVTS